MQFFRISYNVNPLQMSPGLCSMIKVDDVSEPLTEAPDKVSEAVLLF